MNINIIVNGGAYSSQAGYSAFRFAEQALAQGHQLTQVFFYKDGVNQANALLAPLADEFDSIDAWSKLAGMHVVKLVVCVSAAERRGVIGADQQQELGADAHNLHPAFTVAGLGQMHDASLSADRTVTFK